jgi:predicted PurR-regulated permease PerM
MTDAPVRAVKSDVVIFAAGAALAAFGFYLLVVAKSILVPFVIAVLAWYLVNAMATVSRRLRIRGRVLPAFVRFAIALLVVALLSWLVIDLVISNIGQVIAAAPSYERNLRLALEKAADWIGLEEAPQVSELLQGGHLTVVIRNVAWSVTGILGSLGTVAIYLVFLLLEQHSFGKKLVALIPDADRAARVRHILERIGADIQSYIWLKTVMSVLTAGGSYVVMKIVGVDLAAFWALVIFGLNYIPYIGSWLGVIFPTLLALVQFDRLGPFFTTAAGLSVVQFTFGSIVEPKIMGSGLNLSPVVMLLSLAVWGLIWGVVGLFLAVPLMVVAMIVCSQFDATRPIAILMSAHGELRT